MPVAGSGLRPLTMRVEALPKGLVDIPRVLRVFFRSSPSSEVMSTGATGAAVGGSSPSLAGGAEPEVMVTAVSVISVTTPQMGE